MTTRALLLLAGVAAAAYGVYRLLLLGPDNLRATLVWLVGGVVVHDTVLAAVTMVVLVVGLNVLPASLRAPAAGGLVVLGTVTLTAIPVLGRFGASPGNPTLLDRPYLLGWLVLAGLVCAGVGIAWLAGRRRQLSSRR